MVLSIWPGPACLDCQFAWPGTRGDHPDAGLDRSDAGRRLEEDDIASRELQVAPGIGDRPKGTFGASDSCLHLGAIPRTLRGQRIPVLAWIPDPPDRTGQAGQPELVERHGLFPRSARIPLGGLPVTPVQVGRNWMAVMLPGELLAGTFSSPYFKQTIGPSSWCKLPRRVG